MAPSLFTYISASRRPALHAYKYSGTDKSLVSKYILGPYWNALVSFFPKSVAPNTITLSGLALVFLNFITLLAVDGALKCGTDARLQAIARDLNLSEGLNTSAANATAAVGAAVLTLGLPVRPLLARYGLPKSIEVDEAGWGFWNFITHGSTASDHSHCLPHWVYLTWAIGLFAYQSLDSIDGKQARRTGMAGPLGELFDHGCDAINTTLECLLCAAAMNLGRSYWTIASLVATLSNFYLTTWEEYHTGTLFLSAFSGPVEGILMICVIYVITALLGGPAFWDQGVLNVTGLSEASFVRNSALKNWNLPLNDAFLSFGAAGLFANVITSYSNVAAARSKRGQSALTPAAGLLPLILQVAINIFWLTAQDARIIADGQAFIPFCIFWGLSFAYNVGLLIVAHVTKARFPFWNLTLVWSALGAIDAQLPTPLIQHSQAATRAAVYVSLVLTALLYGHFCWHVVTTITDELGTACFVVQPPRKLNKELGKAVELEESNKRDADRKAKGKRKEKLPR
ncbi:hypothetical protein K437DRAFT_233798 [Tilletiaria anomala UBC 951]|uniref:Choline/ethanolaminephosphotransferase n=1 Tax=Tilletiaria anomala (strain ATCC 24038 / CBS 436.72 / UBC 951) TaxID=1037660 RepID=A0A066W730_TILAU|nr:uncharacterized protein K437DRAFT_233798 [Tilletiaria anomala UBC 951]KDN49556.1 hypothetical protein K437DRAFT_233798 [Tilletiaria anomala UBC 951]